MPLRQQLNREKAGFRAGHDTNLPDLSAIARRAKAEAKSPRRDDGSGQAAIREVDTSKDVITHCVDWPTYPHEPHQATALRRSRTEARPRRADNAKKGLTHRGPLQKPGWSGAKSGAATRVNVAPHCAEFIIGRAFARPVGFMRATGHARQATTALSLRRRGTRHPAEQLRLLLPRSLDQPVGRVLDRRPDPRDEFTARQVRRQRIEEF